jgi:hypothetical protein
MRALTPSMKTISAPPARRQVVVKAPCKQDGSEHGDDDPCRAVLSDSSRGFRAILVRELIHLQYHTTVQWTLPGDRAARSAS